MDSVELSETDIIYDLQFKQKLHVMFFPFTWQGIVLGLFCFLMPFNVMEAGGFYVFFGYITYRGFVVKKDHEVEAILFFKTAVDFLDWVKKYREVKNVSY